MAVEQRDIRVVEGGNQSRFGVEEPPLRELFRQLSDDANRLVRQEVELGKVELRESAKGLAKDATKIGTAVGMGLLGAMNHLKEHDLKPTQTMETLRADAEWAKREVEVVKRELKSDGSRSPVQM